MAVTLSAALNALASTSAPDKVIVLEGSTAKQTDPANVGGGAATISPQSDDFTANGASRTVYTSDGAVGLVVGTLPAATAGLYYDFIATDNIIIIYPDGADTVTLYSESNASSTTIPGTGEYVQLPAGGGSARFICTSTGKWFVIFITAAFITD